MGALTRDTPKPLLRAAGYPLVDYQLRALAAAGFRRVVVNTAWHAEQVHEALCDGGAYGLELCYSDEGEALETGGGIARALPLLGDEPFAVSTSNYFETLAEMKEPRWGHAAAVINGDVFADFPYASLPPPGKGDVAHLVLVPNPEFHPRGDFGLEDGRVTRQAPVLRTFAGIGSYDPRWLAGRDGAFSLASVLNPAIEAGRVSGECFEGYWQDVGTRERLEALTEYLSSG